MRDPKIGDSWNKLSPSCVTAVSFSNWNRLYLSASKWEHMTLVVKLKTQQGSREKANHVKINYRNDEELVSSLGLAFIEINFLNFRRSFIHDREVLS